VPNRLAAEQSPYLLQHKDNPVDWYPWGEPAFDVARREDKAIFLSVGYSTCHWCHVMEHESFENPDVAQVLNEHFVSIKVDREERPDVDRVYMTFVQATTGSGGWPMSVWLTPSLQPFYGGTYFPPTSKWGRPGFIDILQEIARVWADEREKVLQSASTIVERLRSMGRQEPGGVPGEGALARGVRESFAAFDARRGGFGDAPKFPRPSELLFLLREHARTGDVDARRMTEATLQAMAIGGMRDHIGGGFHRYSVDGDWRVPHFEKMLYDQAQLVLAYLETAQLTGQRFYADVAADTLEYVGRDLGHPDGGFYSAEDADSVPPEDAGNAGAHKSEGAFYIWREEEIAAALADDADVFRMRFGTRPGGNAPFDPQQEFTGKNLLYQARPVEAVAADAGRSVEDVEAALARARARLFELRARRPRPHLDDKILTAWNGLMIAAYARAGRVLGESRYLEQAARAAEFVRSRLWRPDSRTLLRRYRHGDAAVDGYAEDYAYLIWGLLELFQADGDAAWLDWTLTLQARMDELFWDSAEGGWFSTTGQDPSVLLRLKEDYDGAEPSASAVGVFNLLTLAHMTGEAAMAAKVEQTFSMFAARAAGGARTVPMLMAALSQYHAGMPQLAIVGEPGDANRGALLEEVRRRYRPNVILLPITSANRDRVSRRLPWTAALTPRDGKAAAYLCRNFSCDAPVTAPDALAAQLDALAS
jgi:uncharacterized protein YyaL (SSP411 family)